jgi:hypothetical protein
MRSWEISRPFSLFPYDNPWPRVLREISECEDPRGILEIGIGALEKYEFGPVALYEALLEALSEDSNDYGLSILHGDLAMAILEQMARLELNVSAESAKKSYDLIIPTGDPMLAYKYWMIINHSNSLFTNAGKLTFMDRMVLLQISSGSLEAALFHVAEMRAVNSGKGKLLSCHVNELLIIALLYARDLDAALEETKLLFMESGNLYSRTWGLFISAACDTGHYEALHWAWKNAAIPGRVSVADWCCEQMMDIGGSHGDYEMVRWAFLRKRSHEQHHPLGNSYQRLGHTSEATVEDVTTEVRPLLRLIEARAKSDEVFKALNMVTRAGEGFAKRVCLSDLGELVRCLADSSQSSLNKIINRYLGRKVGRARGSIPESTLTLVFNCLFAAAIASGNLELANQLYVAIGTSLVVPNEDTFLHMLQLARATSDPSLATSVVDDARNRSMPLSRRLLELATCVAVESGDTLTAESLIDTMRANNVKPRQYLLDLVQTAQ